MGKLSRRKQSYVRVEDDHHPGCIWTVFRMINYHPWHTVRKMLPYNKHNNHHDNSNNSKELKPEEHEVSKSLKLGEDSSLKHSSSVHSGSSKNGSSKRSIKARIKAFMKEKDNATESDFQGLDDKSEYDTSAPTLMSLLKANPKLLRSVRHIDDSSNVKPGTQVKNKGSKKDDDFVGVLELFNVDEDAFLRILQDIYPAKPRLVKSGSFPSRNPNLEKSPSKIEHKYNEVWPTSNLGELRKVKSQGFARSTSFKESLEKHGYLFDSSSNKAIKKHLSKSFRLPNEKDSMLLDNLQGRSSFKERLYLSESDSYFASLERWSSKINNGEVKGLRLHSPRSFESSSKSQLYEQRQSIEEQTDSITVTTNCEANDGLTSVSALEVHDSQDDEIEIIEWSFPEESTLESNDSFSRNREQSTQDSSEQSSLDYNSDDLRYIRYVVDIAGFTTGDNQRELWHTQNEPLDPALYDGIEVCCPFEPNSSNKNVMCNSSLDRKILFDLINEALIETHKASYANYYPKALSSWCHVCPKMKGKNRIVEEVWEFVKEYLSWRPELDPALDLAVANDLSKDKNGWVNLQLDTEGLALELEDMIFNELLDEIVCF